MRKALVLGMMVFALLGAGGVAFADDGGLRVADVTSGSWQQAADGSWNYFTDIADPATQVKGDWVVTATGPGIEGLPSGEHRYWIDQNGALALSRVIDPSTARDTGAFATGTCAYASAFGFPATGKTAVGRNVYLAKADGTLETGNKYGILKTANYDSKKRVYYINPKTHSAVVTKAPVKVKGYGWVFARAKAGYLMTGRTVVGNKVYLARANGKLETGNTKGSRKGFLSTKRYGGTKARLYYISPKTHAITFGKPVRVSKKFGYVFAPNKKGYLLRKNTKIDKTHLLLIEKSGRICNHRGFVTTSRYTGTSERYYLQKTSKNKKVLGARIGKFRVNKRTYLGQKNGTLLRNVWQQWGSRIVHVANSGVITVDGNCTRMLRRAQGYSSPSRYLIMVDIDDPRTIVFEGWRGHWAMKFVWECCTGAPSTPTVVGTFSVGAKGHSFGEGNGYSCYYWTQFCGNYLFHTRLYWPYTHRIMTPQLGRRISHGCVRLEDDAAIWIQRNAPTGTTVACIY